MASWILNADIKSKREAALSYLVKGELREQVADQLRQLGIEDTWVSDLRVGSEYFTHLSEDEIFELLYRKLPSIDTLVQKLGDDNYYEKKTKIIPPGNIEATLKNIYEWWQEQSDGYLEKYNNRTYPEPEEIDNLAVDDRSAWMTVLLVGAFHTFGRAKPEHHRNFLLLCRRKGWWDTFIKDNPQEIPERWMMVLEQYIDDQEGESKFEYWMRLFPVIYKFARELEDYIELFYELEKQGDDINVDQTLTSKTFSQLQGGGIAAAPIVQTLGMGVPFVLRELMRAGVFEENQENIAPFCFVPLGRVRNLFFKMGCHGLETSESYIAKSKLIHEFICQYLGESEAIFDNAFDIPFQYVAGDAELQQRLFE